MQWILQQCVLQLWIIMRNSGITDALLRRHLGGLLKTEQSPYQLVQAYQSHFFGKILVIDGALMITERDEANCTSAEHSP